MFGRRRKAAPLRLAEDTYESLYEAHGAALSEADAVGDGSFDLIGTIELGLLRMEGLQPTDTVVDFGCGTGRLAVPLVSELNGGHYIGIDIAQSMLDKAAGILAQRVPSPHCSVSWVKQTTAEFPLEDASVDLMCAFSVFTHMEHEDAFLYLESALRVVRPGGKFIFSCLPLEYTVAREIFVQSARQPLHARWSGVRNVTTSRDLMGAISDLAGWTVVRWYSGNADNIVVGDEHLALGQSSCVLQRPG